MRQIKAQTGTRTVLGKVGENNAVQVLFPVLSGLTGAVIVKRDGDAQPYPVVTEVVGDSIVWTVNSYDTNVSGNVMVEVDYTDDAGTVAKSVTYDYKVHSALGEPSEDVPDPYEDWYAKVLAASASADESKTAAAESASGAAQSAEQASASAVAAENAETAAAKSADEAYDKAATAVVAAENAVNAKTSAQSAQTAAESAATNAAGSASGAGESATAAAQSASDADASATQAAASAQEAKDTLASKADVNAAYEAVKYAQLAQTSGFWINNFTTSCVDGLFSVKGQKSSSGWSTWKLCAITTNTYYIRVSDITIGEDDTRQAVPFLFNYTNTYNATADNPKYTLDNSAGKFSSIQLAATSNATQYCDYSCRIEIFDLTAMGMTADEVDTVFPTYHAADSEDVLVPLYSAVMGKQDILTDADKQAIADMHSDAVTDVQVAGTSVLSDGVANVPAATDTTRGVVMPRGANGVYGIASMSDGLIYGVCASVGNIDGRNNDSRGISAYRLDYAVKAAMCDGKGAAWSSDEKYAAAERLGLQSAAGYSVEKVEMELTEEAQRISLDFGKKFTAITFDVYIPAASSTYSIATPIYVNIIDKTTHTGTLYNWSNLNVRTWEQWAVGSARNNNGIWEYFWQTGAQSKYYNSSSMQRSVPSYSCANANVYPYIYGINMGLLSSTSFPVGMKITVWGTTVS